MTAETLFALKTVTLPILVAGLLPLLAVAFAKVGGKVDNHNVRQWAANLTGMRSRANAAQLNSFEWFPLFALGALIAALLGVQVSTLEALAWGYVGIRVAYIFCYLADLATLRTLVWLLGFAASIAPYILALKM